MAFFIIYLLLFYFDFMKLFIRLFFAFQILCFSLSQAQLRLGLNGGFAIPTGDFGAINKNGYGGSISAKYRLSDRFSLTTQTGFFAFGRAGESLGDLVEIFGLSPNTATLLQVAGADLRIPNVDFFPVNIGFEYHILTTRLKPYVGLDLGFYITKTQIVEVNLNELVIGYFQSLGQPPPPIPLGIIELTGNDSNFGMAPVAGLLYQINERWNIDLNCKANGIYVPKEKSGAIVLSFNLGIFYTIGLYE